MATIYQQNAIEMIFYKHWRKLKDFKKPTSEELENMSISEASQFIKNLNNEINKDRKIIETKVQGGTIFKNE